MHRYIGRRLLALPFVILAVSILVFSLTRLGGTHHRPLSGAGDDRRGGRSPRGAVQPRRTACPCNTWHGSAGCSEASSAGRRWPPHRSSTSSPRRSPLPSSWGRPRRSGRSPLGSGSGPSPPGAGTDLPDQFSSVFAVGGASMPTFWLGIVLLIIFWANLGWFPHGRSDPEIWNSIAHPTNFYVIDSLIAGNFSGSAGCPLASGPSRHHARICRGRHRDQDDALLAARGDG